LEEAGWSIKRIETLNGEKIIEEPTEMDQGPIFGIKFPKTRVDRMMMEGELEYTMNDKGIDVYTDQGNVLIEFNPERFRPAEVPILLSDTKKIQKLGAKIKHSLSDITKHQLNHFLKSDNRLQ
jgi:GDPmannose 4,6-dehydratase